jgi:CheY-like chemotaxis protein
MDLLMNGFEATEYIRYNEILTNRLQLTADYKCRFRKCKLAGMDDYLVKPVDEN